MVAQQSGAIADLPAAAVIAASLILVALALALSAWIRMAVSRDLVIATTRAALQLLVVGLVFTALFDSSRATLWSWMWVGLMTLVSTRVVHNRAKHSITGLSRVAGGAIGVSALASVAVVFGSGVLEFTPVALVVIAGITIGNAMPAAVLGVNQAVTMARDHVDQIEAVLSLGFDRRLTARFIASRAARAALIPQVERTKVVGLIALPGAMTGLLLAGVEPIDAVVIQLVVMYLILGAAAICVVGVVATVSRAAVTPDLRPADWTRPQAGGKDPGSG